jgi:hypothetical protein
MGIRDDISQPLAAFNGPAPYPPADNRPLAMTPVPSNVPATPTTVMQMTGGQPNNADKDGFHQITLAINSPLAKRYQAFPGYWLTVRMQ